MLPLARAAGEADARSTFGLTHGTPQPPPPWAQRWLEEPRSKGTKAVTIPSMVQRNPALLFPVKHH